MADSSFDIVSEINLQEMDNAVNQAIKEVITRYDFKGTSASISAPGARTRTRMLSSRSARSATLFPVLV